MDTVIQIADILLTIIAWAVLIRVLLSWLFLAGINPWERWPALRILLDLTEPLLAPIRSVLMRILPIPFDFSPIIVFFLIQWLQSALHDAARGMR